MRYTYSVWLLLRVAVSGEDLTESGNWKYRLAWAVNLVAVFVWLSLLAITGVLDGWG